MGDSVGCRKSVCYLRKYFLGAYWVGRIKSNEVDDNRCER